MSKRTIKIPVKNPNTSIWTRSVKLSKDDCGLLTAFDGIVFTNNGAHGIQAISIGSGKSLWKVAKGREEGSRPSIVFGRVFMPRGEFTSGGFEMLDCQTGKKLGTISSRSQNKCFGLETEKEKMIVTFNWFEVIRLTDLAIVYKNYLKRAYCVIGNKIIYLLKDEGKERWSCVQISENGIRECWRSSYKDMGHPVAFYSDGLGFYCGDVTSSGMSELRCFQLVKRKKLWSSTIRGDFSYSNLRTDILRSGDVVLHCGELAKGNLSQTKNLGMTAQNAYTGDVLWKKNTRTTPFHRLLASGNNRFWLYYGEGPDPCVFALDSTTGMELMRIPVKGWLGLVVEHNDHLMLLTDKKLFAYRLTFPEA